MRDAYKNILFTDTDNGHGKRISLMQCYALFWLKKRPSVLQPMGVDYLIIII